MPLPTPAPLEPVPSPMVVATVVPRIVNVPPPPFEKIESSPPPSTMSSAETNVTLCPLVSMSSTLITLPVVPSAVIEIALVILSISAATSKVVEEVVRPPMLAALVSVRSTSSASVTVSSPIRLAPICPSMARSPPVPALIVKFSTEDAVSAVTESRLTLAPAAAPFVASMEMFSIKVVAPITSITPPCVFKFAANSIAAASSVNV